MKTSSSRKYLKDAFENRQVWTQIRGADSNIISIKTNMDVSRGGDHIMQNIHQEDKQGWRERATLFDTSVEINTKGI